MSSCATSPSRNLKLVGLAAAVPVCLLWGLVLISRLQPQHDRLHDFVQEWTSGRYYFEGKPVYHDLRESVSHYLGPHLVATLPFHVNAHPPATVLLTLPLARLEYPQAVVVWNVISLAALAAALGLILSAKGIGLSRWAWLPILACVLPSSPLAHQMYMAQLNLVLLLLITGMWYAERSGRPLACGLLFGAATALKLFPAFLGIYLLARRRWSIVAAGMLTFAAINGLAMLVLGGDCFLAYVRDVLPTLKVYRGGWTNASVVAYWTKLFDPVNPEGVVPLWESPLTAHVLIGLSWAGLAAAIGWKARRSVGGMPSSDRAFALAVIGMVLASPIAWHHYFVILILPLIILWQTCRGGVATRGFLIAMIVLLAINPWWPMHAVIPGDGEVQLWPGALKSVALPIHTLSVVSFQCYALMGLFLFALLDRSRSPGGISGARNPDRVWASL